LGQGGRHNLRKHLLNDLLLQKSSVVRRVLWILQGSLCLSDLLLRLLWWDGASLYSNLYLLDQLLRLFNHLLSRQQCDMLHDV